MSKLKIYPLSYKERMAEATEIAERNFKELTERRQDIFCEEIDRHKHLWFKVFWKLVKAYDKEPVYLFRHGVDEWEGIYSMFDWYNNVEPVNKEALDRKEKGKI